MFSFTSLRREKARRRNRELKSDRRGQGPRRLLIDPLESRELFSVSQIGLAKDGLLSIRSDDTATHVEVSRAGSAIRVLDRTTDNVWNFSASKVTTVEFHGGRRGDWFSIAPIGVRAIAYGNGGNDVLIGGNKDDMLRGGAGHDRIWGGDGNDVLRGDAGDDELYGGAGNDELSGHAGNDKLYGELGHDVMNGGDGDDQMWGGYGNDVMYGHRGHDLMWGEWDNDKLYGEGGDDSLYGGSGSDHLDGGDGNDGLYGGDGADTLRGGAGADRFLKFLPTPSRFSDIVMDRAANDAVVNFQDLPRTTYNFTGFGPVTFAAGAWSDAEVETIDVALRNLHQTTGNTRLLKLANGSEMIFARAGAQQTALPGGTQILGGNGGNTITFTPASLSTPLTAQTTTYHEVGHFWDDHHENRFTGEFRQIAGWVESSRPLPGFVGSSAAGDAWQYRASATGFSRDNWDRYGRFNPFEDYATSWEAYFAMRFHGNAGNYQVSPARLSVIDKLFASLA
ncbi:MAG: hypothetical protein KF847_18720 [Pirellulales bacterium]|nr:hypothetical protein [Pirellulales bacterium]